MVVRPSAKQQQVHAALSHKYDSRNSKKIGGNSGSLKVPKASRFNAQSKGSAAAAQKENSKPVKEYGI